MPKPVWEEEWVFDGTLGYSELHVNGQEVADFYDGNDGGLNHDRAILASAAPDMARLLLELERASESYARMTSCYMCDRLEGHKDSCEWLRVMRKAGVR
jgi:hypothetical protein